MEGETPVEPRGLRDELRAKEDGPTGLRRIDRCAAHNGSASAPIDPGSGGTGYFGSYTDGGYGSLVWIETLPPAGTVVLIK